MKVDVFAGWEWQKIKRAGIGYLMELVSREIGEEQEWRWGNWLGIMGGIMKREWWWKSVCVSLEMKEKKDERVHALESSFQLRVIQKNNVNAEWGDI